MNRPLAVVAAVAVIGGGGAVMEQQHVEPVPAIVQAGESAASFAGDRIGDITETARDLNNNPEVHVFDNKKSAAEHETYYDGLLKLGETALALFGGAALALGGIRRWRGSKTGSH